MTVISATPRRMENRIVMNRFILSEGRIVLCCSDRALPVVTVLRFRSTRSRAAFLQLVVPLISKDAYRTILRRHVLLGTTCSLLNPVPTF